MARIRTIKPDVCESDTLAGLDPAVCWTFACLWTHCDDFGAHRSDPRLVKGKVYPLRDDMPASTVGEHLDELEAAGLICRYIACDGKRYLHVTHWDEHQKVDRPSKTRIPPCREHRKDDVCHKHGSDLQKCESSRESREPVAKVSRNSDAGPRTVDRGPRTVDLCAEPARETRTAIPGQRQRDLIWDAVLEACGIGTNAITASARGGYNKAVKEIRDTGATPADVHAHAANYRLHFPQVALTPAALAKHWALVARPPTPRIAPSRNQEILAAEWSGLFDQEPA